MAQDKTRNIDDELDDLALRILELMNEHIECKMNIERLIKSGCLDLAKSRYIMGNKSVTALQFPTDDITAQATVESSTNNDKITFNLNRVLPEVKKQSKQDSEKSEVPTDSEKSKVPPQDPLKWFGLLVPQNLRQGQSWFQKALDISVESANVSAEIGSCENQYRSLLKSKKCEETGEI